jgi:hypothetical protein
MARKLRNRWGSLAELDGRARIGSPKYKAYPKRLQHLTAWRAMHKLAGSHLPVQMSGTRNGVRPSSNLSLALKERFVQRRTQ